jgi:hypothetical protein
MVGRFAMQLSQEAELVFDEAETQRTVSRLPRVIGNAVHAREWRD